MNALAQDQDEIGIVTAFFDIGRGDWTEDKNHPRHLLRTTDTYFEWFSNIAALDNALVVYTSPDLVARVQEMRRGKEDRTTVVPFNLAEMLPQRREAIRRIQKSEAFQSKINPTQACNPEYWSEDYIMVTNLKTVFTAHAIQHKLIRTPIVAWLDFGNFRNPDSLSGAKKWTYPFSKDKVHLFVFSPYRNELSIQQVVFNNVAYVAGGLIVAERSLWPTVADLATKATETLIQREMVDDDQTIMLLAYLQKPDLFDLHIVGEQEWNRLLDKVHIPPNATAHTNVA